MNIRDITASAGTTLDFTPATWTNVDTLYNRDSDVTPFTYSIVTGATWTGSKYVVVGVYSACATSTDGVTWVRQRGLATEIGLRNTSTDGIVSGGSTVLVWGNDYDGVYGSAVYVSTDGVIWTYSTSFNAVFPYGVQYVCWSGSKFVAVGNTGRCATSTDGITWASQASLASVSSSANFNKVVWAASKFIAIGESGVLATSTDGITWTLRTSINLAGDGPGDYDIAWSGSLAVLVGINSSYSPTSYTSTDGITWTVRTGLNTTTSGRYCNKVVYANGKFVTTNLTGDCATSTDGITWTLRTSINSIVGSYPNVYRPIYSLIPVGTSVAAFGKHVGITSSDGITWTELTGFSLYNSSLHNPDRVRSIASSKIGKDSVLMLIASGDIGSSAKCMRSLDRGATWIHKTGFVSNTSSVNSGSTTNPRWSLAYGGGIWVAVGPSAKYLYSVDDGETWPTTTTGLSTAVGTTAGILSLVLWIGDKFIAFHGTFGCATSTNGSTWTSEQGPFVRWISASQEALCACWSGSKLYVVSTRKNLEVSSDGITFTSIASFNTAVGVTKSAPQSIAAIGDTIVAVSTGDLALVSKNGGTTWANIPALESGYEGQYFAPIRVITTPRMFVVICEEDFLMYSIDGINWIRDASARTKMLLAGSFRQGFSTAHFVGDNLLLASEGPTLVKSSG